MRAAAAAVSLDMEVLLLLLLQRYLSGHSPIMAKSRMSAGSVTSLN